MAIYIQTHIYNQTMHDKLMLKHNGDLHMFLLQKFPQMNFGYPSKCGNEFLIKYLHNYISNILESVIVLKFSSAPIMRVVPEQALKYVLI